MALIYVLVMAGLSLAAMLIARRRAAALVRAGNAFHSLPAYHGYFAALAVLLPMLAVFIVWTASSSPIIQSMTLAELSPELQPKSALERDGRLREIVSASEGFAPGSPESTLRAGETYSSLNFFSGIGRLGLGLLLGFIGAGFALGRIAPDYRARNAVEGLVRIFLIACSGVAVLTTVGIVLSVLFETLRFFAKYPPLDFLFGLQWSPQIAIREDQVGQSGAFGFIPLFVGTTLIMVIAMVVAAPVGLFTAIYLAEYASPRMRALAKPVIEVLAGIPTVVFGFFAAITVAPLIRQFGETVGLSIASESALAAGLVMGVMIIPFMSSLSDDVINAVPQSLRDGSYAMGATKSETIRRVVLPAALPGVVSAFLLSVSRAVGETMIVVMAAGLSANLTFNPLEAVTTITVQIKTLLTGDQEFETAKTLSAFALGFVLFFFTLILNVIALQVVRRYREQYD